MKPGREHSEKEFLQHVLYDSAEDQTGVFEVLALADAWYPDWPLDRRLRLAEDTLMRLLTDGLIGLVPDHASAVFVGKGTGQVEASFLRYPLGGLVILGDVCIDPGDARWTGRSATAG